MNKSKKNLEKQLERTFEELSELEVGSEEYNLKLSAMESLQKQLNELSVSRSNLIQTIGGWVVTGALTTSLMAFEKNNIISSFVGKSIVKDITSIFSKRK